MRRAALAALSVTAAAATALAGDIEFKMPSGNIGCLYRPLAGGVLTCLRFEPTVEAVFLSDETIEVGPPESWDRGLVGDAVPVLTYGMSRSFGSISCTSRKSGLTCASRAHGFTMSRTGIETH